MAQADTYQLVEQLTAGFEALQEEYKQLFVQHHVLDKKLATAREQVSSIFDLLETRPYIHLMRQQLALDL